MTDLEIKRLCAEALGWKHLGAVGVNLPEDIRGPHEAELLYPGQLWCLSGGNDWWRDPEGRSVCGRCQSVPDPLHDDAQAMALVKEFQMMIGWFDCVWIANFGVSQPVSEAQDGHSANRAICECIANYMQKDKADGKAE